MKSRFLRIIPPAALLIFIPLSILPQMPDWFFFKDKAGNGYYYDMAFHIRITDEIKFSYDPVTVDGIDFYFNSGIDLVHDGRLNEGLFFLKSIRLLKSENSRITKVQADSTRWINQLYKKQGDRFEDADRESTVLLAVNNGMYELVNEKLFYKMNFRYRPYVIRSAWKDMNKSHGLKLGFTSSGSGADQGCDYMIGIESRIYSLPLSSVEEADEALRSETGYDAMKREVIVRSDDRIIYYYEFPADVPFCGIEGVFMNGRIVHMVRGICHNNLKGKVLDEMKSNITGLVLIKQAHPW